ncbi:MAG: nitroreductase family protein [Planctomycetota bacterium]|jgi:nitroreductase
MDESPFMALVRKRRSVRHFASDPVPEEMIRSCVEAARLAPSAENVQPWRFLAVTDPEEKKRLADAAFSGMYRFTRWADKAPVLVCLSARLDILANRIGTHLQGTQYYLLDLGIAGEHFMLRAVELGLGGCWIGWFDAQRAAKAIRLPRTQRLTELLALGFPAKDPATLPPKKRRPLGQILEIR